MKVKLALLWLLTAHVAQLRCVLTLISAFPSQMPESSHNSDGSDIDMGSASSMSRAATPVNPLLDYLPGGIADDIING